MWVVKQMSKTLVSVAPHDSLARVFQLMKDFQIRHLPVLNDGKPLGIITDQDLRQIADILNAPPDHQQQAHLTSFREAGDVMKPLTATVNVYDTLEEAALTMVEHNVNALPVRDQQGKVVAMLTAKDVLRGMLSLTGMGSGGVQFALELPDEPGAVTRAANIIRKHGGKTVSILTSYEEAPAGRRVAYLRMTGIDRQNLDELKQDLSRAGGLLFVLDGDMRSKEILADLDS